MIFYLSIIFFIVTFTLPHLLFTNPPYIHFMYETTDLPLHRLSCPPYLYKSQTLNSLLFSSSIHLSYNSLVYFPSHIIGHSNVWFSWAVYGKLWAIKMQLWAVYCKKFVFIETTRKIYNSIYLSVCIEIRSSYEHLHFIKAQQTHP